MLALDPAPIAYYRFIDGDTLADSVGSYDLDSNTGTVGYVDEHLRAVTYAGSGQFTDLSSHVAALMALDAMTLAFWFRLDASTSQVLFSLDDSTSVFPSSDDLFWVQWLSGTGLRTFTRINASLTLRAIIPGAWDDGDWHHFALATDATGNTIYMDGAAVTPTYQNGNAASSYLPGDANPTADRVRFGSYGVGGSVVGQHLDGSIDKPAIFDQVLSAGQVADIYEQTSPRYACVLIAGQSNKGGYNSQAIEDGVGEPDEPDVRVRQWGRNSFDAAVSDGEIILAEHPLHNWTMGKNNVSSALKFAKDLLSTLDEDLQILLVPAAKGQSGFNDDDWNQGDTYYEDAKDRFLAAVAHQPMNYALAVLWNQREDDGDSAPRAAAYPALLRQFFTDMMADTATGSVPWLVSGPTDEYRAQSANTEAVCAATETIAAEFANIYYIPTVGLPNDNEDGGDGGTGHFSADAQREIGAREATMWLAASGFIGLYEIHRRATPSGTDQLVGLAAEDQLSHLIQGAAADSAFYYHVKAVSHCGVRDTAPVRPRLRRVAFDGSAELIPPVPNIPTDVTLTPTSGGGMTLTFGYRATNQEVAPGSFNIYVATGATPFDYDTADFTKTYAGSLYTQALGTFADTTVVRVEVRSATSGGDESASSAEATATADAAAPTAPASITAELIG